MHTFVSVRSLKGITPLHPVQNKIPLDRWQGLYPLKAS